MLTPSEFYSFARTDVKDAQLLFKKQRYGNGIFVLQQANEKAGKGLLLDIGLIIDRGSIEKWIKEGENKLRLAEDHFLTSRPVLLLFEALTDVNPKTISNTLKKKYGHAWTRYLLRVLQKLAPIVSAVPQAQEMLDASADMFVGFRRVMPEGDMRDRFLDTRYFPSLTQQTNANLRKYERLLVPQLEEIDELLQTYKKVLDHYKEDIKFIEVEKYLLKLSQVRPSPNQQLELTRQITGLMPRLSGLIAMASLGLLLSPHFLVSRYPTEADAFRYTAKHPLVSRWKQISRLILRSIPATSEETQTIRKDER